MQRVSNEYKEIMNRYIRNRSYMNVSVGVINQEAQESAVFTGEYERWSSQLVPLGNKEVKDCYATMEENFMRADGNMLFLPEDMEYAQYVETRALVSEGICGSAMIELNTAYDIKGITIDFGIYYPTELEIITDAGTFQYSNNSAVFTTADVFYGTTQICITALSMVGGQQRLRINKLMLGVGLLFNNKNILNASWSESVSSVSDELPSIEFSLSVSDENNVFNVDDSNSFINFLEIGQTITILMGIELDSGEIEYMKKGTLQLKSWNSKRGTMDFKATDKFEFMDDTYEEGNYIHERTLYDDAENVLSSYGLLEEEYSIDECLKDVVITNPLPSASYAECLQLIANAGRCILYQNNDGMICIKANFANVLSVEDMSVIATQESEWSNANNILTGSSCVYADLTNNFHTADGSMYFLPENEEYLETGYISECISDSEGMFETNPTVTITLPAAYSYFGLLVDFDGNPPKELLVTTYRNGEQQQTVTFTDLNNTNILHYEFLRFDSMQLEVTKGSPNDRVLIKKVAFGNLSDYVLTKRNMLGYPTGYSEKRTKTVAVKVFTYTEGNNGPEEVSDDVYVRQEINTTGQLVTFENQLIGTQEHAEQIAEWLGNYYANSISYSVDFRGEPRLNAADIIFMESDVLSDLQTEISSVSLVFKGSISGALELRRALRMMN